MLAAIVCWILTSVHTEKVSNNVEFDIDKEESTYIDFKVSNNKVFIYCELTVINKGNEKMAAKPYILMKQDKKNGLLKQAKLYAYDKENKVQIIKLNPGEKINKQFCFIGEYGGNPTKANRLMPQIYFEK